MAEKYTPLSKRIKSALGLGPRDINLPLSGATPAVQRKARAQRTAETIDTLKEIGARVRKATQPKDTESHSYDFRSRNNLRRGRR